MSTTTMYARMYGGKRMHIVTGKHRGVYVAKCGAITGTRSNGYLTPGWYDAHTEPGPYYPVCKACDAATVAQPGAAGEG